MFEKLKTEPTVYMLSVMWKHAHELKPKIILMWILSVCGQLTWFSIPYVFGLAINEIQINGLTSNNLYYILLIFIALYFIDILAWCFHGPSRIIERSIGYKIDKYYKKYLYDRVLSLPLTWHTDHDSGDTIDKVNKATDAVFQFSKSTFNVVRVLIRLVATTLIIYYFSQWITFVAIAFLCLAVLVLIKFDKKLIPEYKAINKIDNEASAKVFDVLSNVTTVKILHIEDPVKQGLDDSWWKSYKIYMKNKISVEWKWFWGSNIFDLVIFATLAVFVVIKVNAGEVVLVGTISTLYLYLKNYDEVYYTFASFYEDIAIQKSRVMGAQEIEDEYSNLNIVKKKKYKNWKEIDILNLDFKYDPNIESSALNISGFKIYKGEKIAVIGESGSGKSSFLKVIHGMYENAKAEVKIDDKTLSTNFTNLELHSTLVPQEPEVFSASIKENITLLLNFEDREIEKAIRMAEFTEVAENLPKKLDSVVNEKGVNLSGGQKQRLALSRALLFSKDKEIILLDESTSSVDPVNEVKIYKNIFENFKDVTIVASIHKMNLLKYFDRIVILDKGKIKKEGNFEYLLENDQGFKNSWEEFVKENEV